MVSNLDAKNRQKNLQGVEGLKEFSAKKQCDHYYYRRVILY